MAYKESPAKLVGVISKAIKQLKKMADSKGKPSATKLKKKSSPGKLSGPAGVKIAKAVGKKITKVVKKAKTKKKKK
jgi:hypothetical protein